MQATVQRSFVYKGCKSEPTSECGPVQVEGRHDMAMARTGANVPATIPALGGEQSLNRYLSEIRRFPILAPEEEYMLAKRFQEHGDTEAASQARHLAPAPRRQDRDGLSRLRPADVRADLARAISA